MIKLNGYNGRDSKVHIVALENIARITEAGTSSQWHGIRSYVKLFDGETIECSDTVDDIRRAIKEMKL